VELKLPPLWSAQIAQEHFLDMPDVLKQLESLITCLAESESRMESILLDLPQCGFSMLTSISAVLFW
jgi:hypothetical protein